jgi:enoyl-[acyl-carrier protein] reductase II
MLEPMGKFNMGEHMSDMQALYFGGDMEAAIPLTGQVCGRIDGVKTVAEIINETVAEFEQVVADLSKRYG